MGTKPGAGAKPGAGKGLRIATGCSTLDEFTAVFRKFCTPNSIFIATRAPRDQGIETRFAITLKDGKPVMRGSGSIEESYPTADNRYGRPGMVIEFIKLDTMGRILLDELNAGTGTALDKVLPSVSQNFEIPTVVQSPQQSVLAAARRSGEMSAVEADARDAAEASPAESQPASPARAERSGLVLPANPFGALSASSLEAFVECTLYEETGETDIAGVVAELGQGGPMEDPILASELLEVNPLKDPPAGSESHPPAFDSAPDALDTEEARAIAAAQVAEDKRPKFIPRPPKLPGVASTEPEEPAAPAEQAIAAPASLASLAEPPSATPPSATPPAPVQPAAVMPGPGMPPGMSPGPGAQQPMLPGQGMHSATMNDGPGMQAPSRLMSALPRNVTRNQALAFAALCLVAGLGFGALVRGDDAGTASADAGLESAGKLSGRSALVAEPSDLPTSESSEGSSETVQVAADAGGAETLPESDVAARVPVDAALEEEDAPEEMLAATVESDAPCVVTLDVLPRAAEITMAEVRSEASASEMLVPCGEHEVRIEHPRYQDYSASFEALPGEATILRARMERPSVYLRIVSTPAKADVMINSRRVGKTPLRHKLPAFQTAKVQVSSPGYKSYNTKYYVKKPGTLKISLRRATKRKPKSSSPIGRRSANR